MAVRALSGAIQGVDAVPIEVEVDLLRRLPKISVVGLPASAVKESAERVRSAIVSAGFDFPRMRIVVNLAPAGVRKEGTALDLPIALAILASSSALPEDALAKVLVAGELSLGGELREVRGALSLSMLARELGRTLILPPGSASQAAVVPGAKVLAARDLYAVVAHLRGEANLPTAQPNAAAPRTHGVDLAEVRGQEVARRALEVAAAGAHHLLMMGPPGCGKSMLARRLPTILPSMNFEESLETARVRSAAGLDADGALIDDRPFRAPHHSVTVAGLIGDRTLRPGEVSLAHNGVLFLDEAAEFRRSVLEVLREPLEDGTVRITRAEGSVEYPAGVTLVMAANPCPCGRRGSPVPCICTDHDVLRYRRRLSGPILDRIDLHIQLEPVDTEALLADTRGETSASVRTRVTDARQRQQSRGQQVPNGRLSPHQLDAFAPMSPEATEVLRRGMHAHHLTGRAASRIRKVARTLADLDHDDTIGPQHIAEALAFRPVEGVS
ncbi:MAG: YifB family Mg chelatase-like AAA ATPase [Proteobacteria bacterium]|nr:YifB family Mg chelatase-like AAA ATPase [Pseudomonadota bacterium]